MPYIDQERRRELGTVQLDDRVRAPGELNYAITCLVDDYLHDAGVCYSSINEVIGALECAKLEVYRRVAAPYEGAKLQDNGEVFSAENLTGSG